MTTALGFRYEKLLNCLTNRKSEVLPFFLFELTLDFVFFNIGLLRYTTVYFYFKNNSKTLQNEYKMFTQPPTKNEEVLERLTSMATMQGGLTWAFSVIVDAIYWYVMRVCYLYLKLVTDKGRRFKARYLVVSSVK